MIAQSDFPLVSCINQCRRQLEVWNKNVFGHVGRKINELQKHLEWLEVQPASTSNIQRSRRMQCGFNGQE